MWLNAAESVALRDHGEEGHACVFDPLAPVYTGPMEVATPLTASGILTEVRLVPRKAPSEMLSPTLRKA